MVEKKRKNNKSKDKFRWEASSRTSQHPHSIRPPSTPTHRTCESSGEEELFEGTARQRHLLLPKGLSGEKKLSEEP